jgi:uncharacterized integral membrane protein
VGWRDKLGGSELDETWQPKLWFVLGGLALLVAYIAAFVIKNNDQVDVHFVVVAARVSLIWVILLSLGIGLLAGLLLSQVYRRRMRRSSERGE